MKTKPINHQRLRQIPPHFSWVDHRLVRQGYLQRCDHAALSLYLFYLTVADEQGMSYYGDPRLMSTLSMTQIQLSAARRCLIAQQLIAYSRPFVQVLSLDESMTTMPQAEQKSNLPKQKPKAVISSTGQEDAKVWIKKLREQLRSPQ